jgi:hypothetical protein
MTRPRGFVKLINTKDTKDTTLKNPLKDEPFCW